MYVPKKKSEVIAEMVEKGEVDYDTMTDREIEVFEDTVGGIENRAQDFQRRGTNGSVSTIESTKTYFREPSDNDQIHDRDYKIGRPWAGNRLDENNRILGNAPTEPGIMCPYLDQTTKVSVYRNQYYKRWFATRQPITTTHPLEKGQNTHRAVVRYRWLNQYLSPYVPYHEHCSGGGYGRIYVNPLIWLWLDEKPIVAHEQYSICRGGPGYCTYKETVRIVGNSCGSGFVPTIHSVSWHENWWHWYGRRTSRPRSASFYISGVGGFVRCNRYEYLQGSDEAVDTHGKIYGVLNGKWGLHKEDI